MTGLAEKAYPQQFGSGSPVRTWGELGILHEGFLRTHGIQNTASLLQLVFHGKNINYAYLPPRIAVSSMGPGVYLTFVHVFGACRRTLLCAPFKALQYVEEQMLSSAGPGLYS